MRYLVVLVTIGIFSATAQSALANTYSVVVTTDTLSGSCGVSCSLRDAVIAANAHAGDDTIALPAGTYTMTFAGAGEDLAATGDFDITDTSGTLTITGAGSGTTTIDANGSDRIFDIKTGTTVIISGVTMTNGSVTDEDGGGILSAGTLTLNNAVVSDNTLNAGVADHYGVGIQCSGGNLTVNATTIDGNYAVSIGGPFVYGGGISIGSGCSGSIDGSTISNNTLDLSGLMFGGGIFSALTSATTLDIADTTIDSNVAIIGGGMLILSSADAHAVNSVRTTINNNHSYTDGGGVYESGPANYTNVTIVDNQANGRGGGMLLENDAATVVSIAASTIVQNAADVIDSTPDAIGGGVYVGGTSVDLAITGSILAANFIGTGEGVTNNDCHEPSSNGDSFIYSLLGTTTDCSFATTTNSVLNGNGSYLATAILADNGGAVQTLDVWSTDTKDVIPEVSCVDAEGAALTEDARGFIRPESGACDMGAVEQDQTAPSAPSGFSAVALGSDVALEWTNPVTDFSSVIIRRSSSAYPTDINDGDTVALEVTGTSQEDASLDDGTYYYSIFALDAFYNVSTAAHATVVVDTVTQTPTLVSPMSGTYNLINLVYSLPEAAQSNSVTVTFTNTDSQEVVLHLSDATSMDLLFNPSMDPDAVVAANSLLISSITTDFATVLPDGNYTITLSYRDVHGNPVVTTSATDIVIDTVTQAPILIAPIADQHMNIVRVYYDLPEPVLAGSVSVLFTNSESETLALTLSTGLEIDFSFDPTATLSEVQLANSDIMSAASSFDTALPDGTYTVTLSYQDLIGNASVTTTVHDIVIDTVKPTITLIGEEAVTLTQGDVYSDAGATAVDSVDGDLTSEISIDNTVDTDTLGEYTITYNVSDAAGNEAVIATRTVTVVAATPTETPVRTITTNGKVVSVLVDGTVVDRVKINKRSYRAKFSTIVQKDIYPTYTSVIVLTVGKHKAKITVLRLTNQNTLTRRVSTTFAIEQRTPKQLRVNSAHKRIVASTGKGAAKHTVKYQLTKKGKLKPV